MAARKSIFVANLPVLEGMSLSDKLHIYFGKRANGGGDIDSVQLENQNGHPLVSAIITFAEEETVSSVLMTQHVFYGKKLIVDPYHPISEHVQSQDGESNCVHVPENLSMLRGLDPWKKVKLIISAHSWDDCLESIAASTMTKLEMDERTALFTFTGRACDVMRAAAKLARSTKGSRMEAFLSKEEDMSRDDQEPQFKTGNLQLVDQELQKQTGARNQTGSIINEQLTHAKITRVTQTKEKSSIHLPHQRPTNHLLSNKIAKQQRHTIRFEQKVLDYLNLRVANHQKIEEIRKEFKVDFEARPGGTVEVNSKGPETDHQNIEGAIQALEDLVNRTKELDLITEIVDVIRLFPEASAETIDAAVQQTMKSTQVLVTQRMWNRLEFYGTDHEVHQEIAKLRRSVLGEESRDEVDAIHSVDTKTADERNFHGHNPESTSQHVEEIPMETSLIGTDLNGITFPDHAMANLRACANVGAAEEDDDHDSDDDDSDDEEDCDDDDMLNVPLCQALDNAFYEVETNAALCCQKHEGDSSTSTKDDEIDFAQPQYYGKFGDSPMEENALGLNDKDSQEESRVPDAASPMSASQISFVYTPPDTDPFRVKTVVRGGPNSVQRKVQPESVDKLAPSTLFNGAGCAKSLGRPSGQEAVLSRASWADTWEDAKDVAESFSSGAVPFTSRVVGNCGSTLTDGDFTITLKTGMNLIIRRGNLINEFTNVIVVPADPHLRLQHGAGYAVKEAGGPELVTACRRWVQRHGAVKPGKSVWTTGGNLKCSHVLHVVPPQWEPQADSSKLEVLRETILDILKTCTHKLEASMVSMPVLGAGMGASRKVCALAFFDAVLDITKLYQQGWMGLETLVLVDQNWAAIAEHQQVFSDAIISGYMQDFIKWDEDDMGDTRQVSHAGECADNIYNEMTSVEPWKSSPSTGAVPRRQPRGLGGYTRRPPWKRPACGAHLRKKCTDAWVAEADSLPPERDNQCSICLGNIRREKKLHCGHRFCSECVNTWLKDHKSCPYCKQTI
ncbi:uncharacterized protein LOC110982880 [Acanthaster planci]|uniref:Uncharacterized protein LOC110982880 n=1 Tax=Acanthaster planci TaxID=133434 RepID=A0A8B7YXA3_ACAPL|nr:uncharacterized protein LOC110982880 [Acanthaster planci]XP_022097317.1 uncharacterized protein LOC110982880 [Acanthaster planci]